MRKIISFKKELMFKTKVCEITSISLEHIIKEKDEDLVSGEFLITGDYKMTEGSINREKYNFNLPFDIALNSNYDVESVNIEIDNFYYEIVNNEILKVNIELLIDALEKEYIPEPVRKSPTEELIEEDFFTEEEKRKMEFENINIENEIENIKDSNIDLDNTTNIVEKNIKELENNEKTTNNNININNNIFDNLGDNETYSTYYVYIVKEDDTIDKILEKYNITKEELENYNNIESIKPCDKIIIPTNGKWFKRFVEK